MENITFKNIYTSGHVIFENSLYEHYHFPEMLLKFDSNFIAFKRIPSLAEFKEAETYLSDFHLNNGQKHVKFYFPENEKPAEELTNYFNDTGYDTGYNELYAIMPKQFPMVKQNEDIEIQAVTEENLDVFLKLQYETDLQFGEAFAMQKIDVYKQNFKDEAFQHIMAFYKGIPAGSVDVIITEHTAEIDGLNVKESFQKRGIGLRLQRFVMDRYCDKTVILIADGQDTPRDMYQKQNYQYLGFKYESQKVYEE